MSDDVKLVLVLLVAASVMAFGYWNGMIGVRGGALLREEHPNLYRLVFVGTVIILSAAFALLFV